MRGMRAACLVALVLGLVPWSLQAQDAPPDNTKESNRNPMPEPPTVFPDRPLPLRLGLSAAIGAPHLLNGSLEVMWGRMLGFAIGGGHVGIKADKTNFELGQRELALRFFPFGGSFFAGAAYGVQKVVLNTEISLLGTSKPIRSHMETQYVTPQIGWLKRWNFGLMIGLDAGYQFPLSTKFQADDTDDPTVQASPEYQQEREDQDKKVKQLGKKPYPSITFFRIGWLF